MSSSQTRFVLGLILGLMLQPVAAHSQSQRESQHATALADLLREQAARVDRLNIPAQICKAAIIDDGAVAGSFCQFAALLLKDSQFEVLPFIQGTVNGQMMYGLPLRRRGYDDMACLFRSIRGDLVFAGIQVGDDVFALGQPLPRKDEGAICRLRIMSLSQIQPEAPPVPPTPRSSPQTSQPPSSSPKPDVDNVVDGILKNKDSRTKIQTPENQPKPVEQITRQAPSTPNLAAVASPNEIGGVRNKIRPCWSSFGGAKDAPVVTLVVHMNQDGTPAKAEVVESARYNSDPVYHAAADSAWRAIMNPRCQPWPLSPEKYNAWRVITFNFDPRDY